jgi:excinuclease ABC subunit C
MNEAVFRRYKRLLNEEKPLPELVFIDGGKGQLSAAAEALQSLDLEGVITLVGLVKPPKRHSEISHLLRFGQENNPIYFDANSLAFRLVQQIRDETHKTAVQYHRKRREMRDFTSELTAIEGVGEKRKLKLLRNFGSIERIAKASTEELTPFVGAKAAKQVFDHFERQRKLANK